MKAAPLTRYIRKIKPIHFKATGEKDVIDRDPEFPIIHPKGEFIDKPQIRKDLIYRTPMKVYNEFENDEGIYDIEKLAQIKQRDYGSGFRESTFKIKSRT